MAHSHMVGGFWMHTTPAFDAIAMAKPRSIRGKIGNGRYRLLPVLLRVGTHIGHGSHQHANPPGFMHYDQETMHQRWVYVMTCVHRVMDSNIHDTIHTCTAPRP